MAFAPKTISAARGLDQMFAWLSCQRAALTLHIAFTTRGQPERRRRVRCRPTYTEFDHPLTREVANKP